METDEQSTGIASVLKSKSHVEKVMSKSESESESDFSFCGQNEQPGLAIVLSTKLIRTDTHCKKTRKRLQQ